MDSNPATHNTQNNNGKESALLVVTFVGWERMDVNDPRMHAYHHSTTRIETTIGTENTLQKDGRASPCKILEGGVYIFS